MRKKKLFNLFLVGMVALLAILTVNIKDNSEMKFSLNHVEAYASDSEGSETSWRCTGSGKCYAHCGECGTTIDGKGDLSGSHSCD